MSGPRAGRIDVADGASLRTLAWPVDEARGRVLVVHGFSEHAGRYDLLAEALNRRGWGVLAYDQRGHGDSDGRRGVLGDFDHYLNDLDAVRGQADRLLPGPGDPFLLGHSLGGLVVLRYLQRRRPRVPGAILSAPWLATALPVPRWKSLLGRVLLRVAPDLTLANGIHPERLTRDPARARAYEEDPRVHHRVSAGLFHQVQQAQAAASRQAPPAGIPLLLLLPGDDQVADATVAASWASAHASADLETVWLRDRRHEPFNDLGREEVFRLLDDWLSRVQGAEPDPTERVSSGNPSTEFDRA